ncbi:hypothetical protein F2P79_021000 [Pimephales promelas]|nr:hypothetical protein F2P79_021000 [Pimephales promelas]KAG1932749.1 hypothetical protein F2P79_021000 [Pimephales promelas]
MSATAAEVEKSSTLPDSLRLIVLGEILTATQWMLSIEGQVVLNQHPNFMAEFAALFATYYNFNLVYQHEASCTLEFVQRCLPRTSMKVERPQRRGTTQSILLFSLGYPVDLEWLSM